MRRHERERSDKEFLEGVLGDADDCSLALLSEDGPYVLPINYAYADGKIYVHCAKEGHKLDLIRKDPRVGFTVYTDVNIVREKSSTEYRSVCGSGIATILEDTEEKRAALDAIALKYKSSCPVPTPDSAVARTTVIRIAISHMTGKCATVATAKE